MFNITSSGLDPFAIAASGNAGFAEINQLEQENLMIDAVALGDALPATLDNIPGLDLGPLGMQNAENGGIDYLETIRDQNNQQIDQILQGMSPQAPTGGTCQ